MNDFVFIFTVIFGISTLVHVLASIGNAADGLKGHGVLPITAMLSLGLTIWGAYLLSSVQ